MPRDFNGASLAEVEDEVRFKQARPGDHLCVPFQCPSCQSQNIRGKGIDSTDISDLVFECMVIRATLDAFWSRSSKTVSNHVREVRNMARYGGLLGYSPLPVLGPWSLSNHFGMGAAVMVLMRSMEKGRAGGTVKYGTARKARATLTILWESSPMSGDDLTLSAGSVQVRYVATLNPSEGCWYQHFESGICARMGDVVSQDRAYTIEVLLALLDMFEQEWQTYYLDIPLTSLSACMFLLVSSLGGMRGFEVVWTDLAALCYDMSYCEAAEDQTAVSWPIVGRFKARHGILDCCMIPIAGVTNSGIQFFVWTQRFVRRLAREGFKDGWAFRRGDGSRAKASDYQDNIFRKLEIIQATTNLIDPGCSVWDEYGIQRSGRRFFTTRCTNRRVDKHDIELQCRWSTDRANGVRTVQRSMIHNNSEVRNMKQALIRPSKTC
jgi:hypothetical protein